MNPYEEFGFQVGEKYENEKGPFSVVSIEKDAMVIQWANGEETQTSLKFQDRIQKRRQWEKASQNEEKAPKKARSSKPRH